MIRLTVELLPKGITKNKENLVTLWIVYKKIYTLRSA